MYEKTHHELAPINKFVRRIIINLVVAIVVLVFSLGLGMLGYMHFEGMNIVDAYVNAAMILSGMGPVGTLSTSAGKIFAGTYAIFSGVIFLIVMAILFAPIFHRFFHAFMLKDIK